MRNSGGYALRGTAKEAVEKYGDSLVGNIILSAKVGDWPGGLCEVTKMLPDGEDSEILFNVRNYNGEIGIFENEEVELYPKGIGSTLKEVESGETDKG